MKSLTQPLATLAPKDAVSTTGLQAAAQDEKPQAKSYSLPKRQIRLIRQHASKLSEEEDKTVSESAALRDIIDRAEL